MSRRVAKFFWLKCGPGGFDDFAHFLHAGAEIAEAEEGGAADEGIGSGSGAFPGGLEINPAVHADAVVELLFTSPRCGLLDLGQHFVNERLAAKSRIDGHNE